MSGKNNEDRFAVSAFLVNEKSNITSVFAVVSDGIGGNRAGEVAAAIAVETISKIVGESDASNPQEILEHAIIEASERIFNQAEQDSAQKGMGATCACGWIIGDRLYTASVGDSRIYLLRDGLIHQLTTDHTWIQEAIELGAITPDQKRGHPNAHVIRRYLGSRQPVIPDLRIRLSHEESDKEAESNQGMRLKPHDQIILCSDGLTDLVEEEEILQSAKTKKMEEAIDELINLANKRGGHDNITIVSLKMPEAALAPAPTPVAAAPSLPALAPKPAKRWGWGCLGLAALLLAVLGLGGASILFVDIPGLDLPGIDLPALQTIVTALAPAAESTAAPGTFAPLPGAGSPTSTPTRARLTPTRSATATPSPGLSPTATPRRATLTPWPTNTSRP
jgi:protein phosphatase